MPRYRALFVPVLFALAVVPASAAAQGSEPRTHTVKAGDTLWDLAQLYLGDPFRWPEIYRRNQSTIQDPNLIYPDQVIVISGEVAATPGTPTDTAVAVTPVDTDSLYMDTTGAAVTPPSAPPSMTIFNPDRYRVVRGQRQSLQIQDPASAVRVGDYLSSPLMWEASGVVGAGRLIEGSSTDGIGIQNTQRPIQYLEDVWVQLPQGVSAAPDVRLVIFRYGPTVAGRGRVVVPTGIIRLSDAVADGRARGTVIAKFEDVFAGQHLMVEEAPNFPVGVFPARVEFGVSTTVAYVHGGHVLPNVGDQLIFAAAASDGLVPGDQLTLSVPSEPSEDGAAMPPRDVAVAQVTRVTPWGASAIIISQTDGGVKTGVAARVTGKMP